MAEEETAKATLSLLKGILEKLDRLQTTAVPVGKLTEVVRGALQAPPTKAEVPPGLQPLVEKAGDLGKLCDLAPELCEVIEAHRAAKARNPVKSAEPSIAVVKTKPLSPAEVHNALLKALREAGQELLGREPTWNDLLNNCPNGDCGLHIAPLLAKHPELLERLVEEEGAADTIVKILQKAGKLPEPPETPKPETPKEEVVDAGGEAEGTFAGILRE